MESQGLAVLFRGHSFQFSADGQEYCSVSLEVWVSGKMRQTTVPRVTKSSLYHSLAVCKWFHFSKPHLSRLLIRNSNRCPLYFVRLSASESPVTVVTKHLSVMGYHIIMPIVLPFYYEFALYGSSFVFIFIFLYLPHFVSVKVLMFYHVHLLELVLLLHEGVYLPTWVNCLIKSPNTFLWMKRSLNVA